MIAKNIHQPQAQVTKVKAPPVMIKSLDIFMLPFDICQYPPARQLKATTRVAKIKQKTTLVRSARMRKMKHRRPMAKRKKAGTDCGQLASLATIPGVTYRNSS